VNSTTRINASPSTLSRASSSRPRHSENKMPIQRPWEINVGEDQCVIYHEHGRVVQSLASGDTQVCIHLDSAHVYELKCPGCDKERIWLSGYKLHKLKCIRDVCETCAMPEPINTYDHDCVFRTAASSSGFSEVTQSLDRTIVLFVLRTPPTLKELPSLIKKAVEWVKANGRTKEATIKFLQENPV